MNRRIVMSVGALVLTVGALVPVARHVPARAKLADGEHTVHEQTHGAHDHHAGATAAAEAPVDAPNGPISAPANPEDCSAYPGPRRWFLESQGWWMRTGSHPQTPHEGIGGHIHIATCFPANQAVPDGIVPFDVRVMIHKQNAGRLQWVDIGLGTGGSSVSRYTYPDNGVTCPVTDDQNCIYWVRLNLDTGLIPQGYQQLRFRANVLHPNGERHFPSTNWHAFFRQPPGASPLPGATTPTIMGSNPPRPYPWTEAKGWYPQTSYNHEEFLSELPTGPLSGIWRFTAAVRRENGDVPLTHHSINIDGLFNVEDWGTTIIDGVGELPPSTIEIDTRKLTPGLHFLDIKGDSPAPSGGTTTGILAIPFVVADQGQYANGANLFVFDQPTVRALEGNTDGRTMTFTVRRLGDTSITTTVRAQTGAGTGAPGGDYDPMLADLEFPPGVTTRTVSVPLRGDTAIEPEEAFPLLLTSPTNGFTVPGYPAVGVVVDDDTPVKPGKTTDPDGGEPGGGGTPPSPSAPTLSVKDVSTKEGTNRKPGKAKVTFALDRKVTRPVHVNWSTADDTAIAPGDYAGVSAVTTTIPAGKKSVSVTISLVGDAIREAEERFKVVIASATGAVVGRGSAFCVIRNDD